jgi:hypothetical protein
VIGGEWPNRYCTPWTGIPAVAAQHPRVAVTSTVRGATRSPISGGLPVDRIEPFQFPQRYVILSWRREI